MVKAIMLLAAWVALTASPAWAGDGCTQGSEFEPPSCPLRLPRIKTLRIDTNAAKAVQETDPAVDCSAFKLQEKQVRRFFLRARTADENNAHHTLDWSACHASGTLSLANGKQAQWRIDQSRTGTLAIDGAEALFLYCPACNFAPF